MAELILNVINLALLVGWIVAYFRLSKKYFNLLERVEMYEYTEKTSEETSREE